MHTVQYVLYLFHFDLATLGDAIFALPYLEILQKTDSERHHSGELRSKVARCPTSSPSSPCCFIEDLQKHKFREVKWK